MTNLKRLSGIIQNRLRTWCAIVLAGALLAQWLAAAPLAGAVPAPPSGLTATVVNAHRIDLTWVNNTPNARWFHIESSVYSFFPSVDLFTADVWQANATGYRDTSVYPGYTFYYRVYAVDAAGAASQASNVASAYVSGSAANGPAAPTGLAAAASGSTRIGLSWHDNSSDETGFTIERAGNTAFTTGIASFTVGPNVQAYGDQSVVEGPVYYYRVRSFNASGESAWSNAVSASTAGFNVVPAAPSGLSVTSASVSGVSLSWVDNSGNETGFRVERAADGAFATGLASFQISAGVASYSDTSVVANALYYYRVVAFNLAGDSSPSNVVSAVTAGVAPPSSACTLAAMTAGPAMVALTWAGAGNVQGFRLERASNPAFSAGLVSFDVAASAAGYTDVSVAAGTTYYYRVFSSNGGGLSPASNTIVVTTPASFAVPSPPSRLVAVAISSHQINLKWVDNSTDEAAFEIERALDADFTSSVIRLQVVVDTMSYGDVGVVPGTMYYYRVYAMGETGRSSPSNTAAATALGTVPAMGILW